MDELRMHQKMSSFWNLIGWESISLINDLDKDKVQTKSLPLPRSFEIVTAQKTATLLLLAAYSSLSNWLWLFNLWESFTI